MKTSWRALRRSGLSLLVLGTLGCVLAAPACADTFLSAYKGVPSTIGEPQSYVYGYDDAVPSTVRVVRAGALIDSNAATFDLVPGDVIELVHRNTSALLASATFDGLPALDATTCAGSAAFAGTRTGTSTVNSVSAYSRTRVTGRYSAFDSTTATIRGNITTVGANTFSGTFSRAIPDGFILRATQIVLLSETAAFDETVERFVGACPPPLPPPPPPPDTTAPTGSLTLPAFLSRSKLLGGSGINLKVKTSEAGKVKVDLYLDNGAKLPALTAAAAAAKKKPKLIRVAGGQKTASAAGTVTVKVKRTTIGRKTLRSKKRTKVRVLTTLTDAAGNRKRLPVKKSTIR